MTHGPQSKRSCRETTAPVAVEAQPRTSLHVSKVLQHFLYACLNSTELLEMEKICSQMRCTCCIQQTVIRSANLRLPPDARSYHAKLVDLRRDN